MKIEENSVVTLHYILTDGSGNILDNTGAEDPFTYVHGRSRIFPDIRDALEGREKGETLRVIIPPERAYGNRDDSMVTVLPRKEFSGIYNLSPGMQLPVRNGDDVAMVRVLSVEGGNVTVDGNHPLAGETLVFDLTIDNVREAGEGDLYGIDAGFMGGPDQG